MATNLPSCFLIQFLEQLLKFLVNLTLLKYVKSQRSYVFLITKELIFGFQILDLQDHFSASLINTEYTICSLLFSPSSQAREKRNEKKSSIDFQGCYSANEFNPVKKFIDNKNLNLKCAKKCRDKAFVLAVTQGSTCGCSNDLPPKQLARPEHSNSSGADSKCNMKCPGAYTRKQCEGDECCGGQNAFTVYTVGGMCFFLCFKMKALLRFQASGKNS